MVSHWGPGFRAVTCLQLVGWPKERGSLCPDPRLGQQSHSSALSTPSHHARHGEGTNPENGPYWPLPKT